MNSHLGQACSNWTPPMDKDAGGPPCEPTSKLSRAFRMKRDTIYKPALRLDVVEKTVFHLKRHYRGILSLITSSSHFSSIGFAVPPDPGIDPLGDLYSSPICRSQRRQTAMPSRSGSRLQESASATQVPLGFLHLPRAAAFQLEHHQSTSCHH